MNDHELEAQLRERLRTAELPPAPTSLRRILADMPDPPTGHPRRRGMGRIVLLAAAILAITGLGIGGALQRAPQRDIDARVMPPAIATDPDLLASDAPAGFALFEAPGIAFAYPADWNPSSAFDDVPTPFGRRFVGTFTRGLTLCPLSGDPDTPRSQPPGCVSEAREPGMLILQVTEYLRQLPGALALEINANYAGHPAASPGPWVGSNPAYLIWRVMGPDNSLYAFWAHAASTDIESVRGEVEAMLATLQLSSWQPSPEVVNGLIHVETGQGFAFDYPADWTIYYPTDISITDVPVVTVASQPVEPPCLADTCQRFSTPPGTAVVEFRIGSSRGELDWSSAESTVAGQPAFTNHWDGPIATSADEGDQWSVKLDDDRRVLGIYSSLRGPGVDDQRAAVRRVIDSVRIDAPAP